MLKFLHSADWHLGAPNLLPEYRELAIPKLFSIFRSSGASFIIVAGDVFDSPEPKQTDKDLLLSFFTMYQDVLVILMAGNHDKAKYEGGPNSINTFSILSNVMRNVVVCEPGCTLIPELETTITVLPDDYFKDTSKYVDLIEEAKDKFLKYNIAIWHGIVPGITFPISKIDKQKSSIVSNFTSDHGFDYLALGDIHQQMRFSDSCWYPGSLFQKTFSCQAGVLSVSIDKSKKIKVSKIELGLPKKTTIRVDSVLNTDTEEMLCDAIGDQIDSQVIKVVFTVKPTVWAGLDKKKIKSILESKYKVKHLRMSANLVHEDVEGSVEPVILIDEEVKQIVELLDVKNKKEVTSTCIKRLDN